MTDFSSFNSPLVLPPPGMAPADGWMLPRVSHVWMDSSGAGAGAGTGPGSGGGSLTPAGGTGGILGTVETGGTDTAGAGTPRFAGPTGR